MYICRYEVVLVLVLEALELEFWKGSLQLQLQLQSQFTQVILPRASKEAQRELLLASTSSFSRTTTYFTVPRTTPTITIVHFAPALLTVHSRWQLQQWS